MDRTTGLCRDASEFPVMTQRVVAAIDVAGDVDHSGCQANYDLVLDTPLRQAADKALRHGGLAVDFMGMPP